MNKKQKEIFAGAFYTAGIVSGMYCLEWALQGSATALIATIAIFATLIIIFVFFLLRNSQIIIIKDQRPKKKN
jgi:cobalamin biosynthesis protein CobD/CbiB